MHSWDPGARIPHPGRETPDETIRSFEEICDGKYYDLPEQTFRYVGPVELAVEKAQRFQG